MISPFFLFNSEVFKMTFSTTTLGLKRTAVATTLLFIGLNSAHAASTEAEFDALLKEKKTAEAYALAQSRIKADPADGIAVMTLSNLVLSGRVPDADKARDNAIKLTEACLVANPTSFECTRAASQLYGVMAMSGGMMAGMKYAPKIKEFMLKAVELQPKDFDARRDLNQFYIQAPGIAGGSISKAKANAESFKQYNASLSKLLLAEVHIYEKEYPQAQKLLNEATATDDKTKRLINNAYFGLGISYLTNEKVPESLALFQKMVAEQPEFAVAHFGLGRAQLASKQHDAAIASLERTLVLDSTQPAHYRLGIAYQEKGNKAKAIEAFTKFLSYQNKGKAVDDVNERLKTLKG
jgi:tetratricopeptide (TPR) repeat protein